MLQRVERLGPDALGEAITGEESLIIFFGMYGCAPCSIFEERCDDALHDTAQGVRMKYVKLRPSQFRQLQERSIIDSVPVAISFRAGSEYRRIEGLPGPVPPDDYRDQLIGIVKMLT